MWAWLGRRRALQVVALEDIRTRVRSLAIPAHDERPDAGQPRRHLFSTEYTVPGSHPAGIGRGAN